MSARPAALHFHGPFTFVDHGRRRAGSEFARSEWIYLGTMRDDPAPIYGGIWRDRSEDALSCTVQAWLGLQQEIHAHRASIEVSFAPTQLPNETRKMQGIRIAVTAEVPIEGLDSEIEV